jgi:DNA-binding MarR family transcriptional regulator
LNVTTLKQRLLDYIETTLGEHLDLLPEAASALPLFLRERYVIFSTRLFGRKVLLALEAEDWEGGSPGEYGKHQETLKLNLSENVVLVLPILPSYARNRMVQMGIPFIIPGSQIFIPNTVIDLRERFPQPNIKRKKTLGPAAQCTVLYHLLRESLAGMSLKEIAQKVQYSPIMLSKVKDELEAAGICKIVRDGRSLVLEFTAAGRPLWDQVQPQLTSPVKKTRWVRWDRPAAPALLAGVSALSRLTMIAADRLPTYALPLAEFQDFLERGVCTGCRDSEHATVRIEVWSYPPERLGDNEMVDPLSLYLSLRDSQDERIQQQLEKLIAEVKW